MPKWAAIMLHSCWRRRRRCRRRKSGQPSSFANANIRARASDRFDENADALQCLSYINGFVAGASIVAGPRPFCIPATATLVRKPMPTWPGQVSTPTC